MDYQKFGGRKSMALDILLEIFANSPPVILMSKILEGILSSLKELVAIVNWICTIIFLIGLLAVSTSPQGMTTYLVEQYFIPSLLGAIFTDVIMEFFRTIIPSSGRTLLKIIEQIVELVKTLIGL
jgi:hypothetical protein